MDTVKSSAVVVGNEFPESSGAARVGAPARGRTFFFLLGGISVCFAKPLYDWVRVAMRDEINSHVLLIPAISLYLFFQRRSTLPRIQASSVISRVLTFILPLALVAISFVPNLLRPDELLSVRIGAFCLCFFSAVITACGWSYFRALLFPLLFLLFMIPLPLSVIDPLETASKIASTEAYVWMMDLSESTYIRHGFVFALPGLNIEVAQECSGIRSSLVLFIVSLLAGNLFLTSTWRRLLFCFFVIPLGVIRNGFRIFTLSFLSVHWDPSVIHSPLHHRGGPLFFALSLIPFCLVLGMLRKSEARKATTPARPAS
jgi:exosortase C (VPDSG-CTERM-specific)